MTTAASISVGVLTGPPKAERGRRDESSSKTQTAHCGCSLFRSLPRDLFCNLVAEHLPLDSVPLFYQALEPCMKGCAGFHVKSVVFDALVIREKRLFGEPKLSWRRNIHKFDSLLDDDPANAERLRQHMQSLPGVSKDLRPFQQAVASMLDICACEESDDNNEVGGNRADSEPLERDDAADGMSAERRSAQQEPGEDHDDRSHIFPLEQYNLKAKPYLTNDNNAADDDKNKDDDETSRQIRRACAYLAYQSKILIRVQTKCIEAPVWSGTFPVSMNLEHEMGGIGYRIIHRPNIVVSMPITEDNYRYRESAARLRLSLTKYLWTWKLLSDHCPESFLSYIPQPYNFLPVPPYGCIRGRTLEDRRIVRAISLKLNRTDLVLTVPIRASQTCPIIVRIVSPEQARRRWRSRSFGQRYQPPLSWVVSDEAFQNEDGLIVSWEPKAGVVTFRPQLSTDQYESLFFNLLKELDKYNG